jgi:glycosyltransferase involved in cell wall biosynthesis
MNIFYLYSQPRKIWERQVKLGRMPDHVLYGLNHLRRLGHQVTYSDAGFSRFNLLKWPISPLQRWFLHRFGVGFQLDQALLLLPRLRQADVIITTNDSCGLPVAFLKWLGLLKTPQVYFHIGFKSNPYLSRLLRQPEALIDFTITPPGVDTKFFRPKKLKPKFDILAVGRDPGRDYRTLFQAVKDLPIKIKVICDPKNITGLSIPANVTVKHFASYLQVRQAYWQSKIVVIPTQKHTVSGQISLLEALACGKPVIAANTPALNIVSTIYYQPERPQSLKRQIIKLLNHPKVQFNLPKHFSSYHFSRQLNQLIKS